MPVRRLPDNNEIELGTEVFEAPEVLFNPEIIGLEYAGVPQTLVNSIDKSDMDIRKTLYGSITLSGGAQHFNTRLRARGAFLLALRCPCYNATLHNTFVRRVRGFLNS